MGETGDMAPERDENAVKGDFGHVLVVSGSRRYVNTPAIVALGALRSGIDLLTVAAPVRSADISASFALNIISEPLDGDNLAERHLDTVLEIAGEADCLAVGPGLGRREETRDAVVDLLDAYEGRAVVDADAIHAAAERPEVLRGTVVTPHAGEFEVLTGERPGEGDERIEAVQDAARVLDCTVLLKGVVDIISDGEGTETNDTGNPYMTRGGTGDVLTGITAGIIAQGLEPFEAAAAAARVNGEAGNLALEEYGKGFLLEEMLEEVSMNVEEGS